MNKIKLKLKEPQFNLLSNGTRVVFATHGCSCNIWYQFGIVVENKRGQKKFQEVHVTTEESSTDIMTSEEVVNPQWDKPIGKLYTVAISHTEQYLKGYGDAHPSYMMDFIPVFNSIYNPDKIYTNYHYYS